MGIPVLRTEKQKSPADWLGSKTACLESVAGSLRPDARLDTIQACRESVFFRLVTEDRAPAIAVDAPLFSIGHGLVR